MAFSPATTTACSGSWPTASSSPTRSASTRMKSFSTSSRRPAARITRLRIDDRRQRRATREIFGPVQPRQRRLAGRHRLRYLRQPVGHAGLLGQAVRVDAARRSAGPARRRRSRQGGRAGARRSAERTLPRMCCSRPGRGVAPWMASVTFGGPDLRTVYIGSLKVNESRTSGRRSPACRWCIGMKGQSRNDPGNDHGEPCQSRRLWLADGFEHHRNELLDGDWSVSPLRVELRGRLRGEDIRERLPDLTSACTRSCTVRSMSR